ncbi:hypothetical protein ABID42_001379 [Arcicella rosea]
MTEIVIEIFKTNVSNKQTSDEVLNLLKGFYPHLKINFDLDDCDNILRVQGHNFPSNHIVEILSQMGLCCERIE